MQVSRIAGWALLVIPVISILAVRGLASEASQLTPEKCLKRLPSQKRATENYREYYLKFADMICSGEVAKDKVWQSCVLKGMSGGRYKADNISDAYNDCNPLIHACVGEMNTLARPRSQKQREFFRNFCLSGAEASKTEKSCFVDYTRRDPSYLSNPASLYVLCIDEAQECVQDFLTHGSFKKSRAFLDGLSIVCHRPLEDIDAEWRACMRGAFDSGRFIDAPSVAWRACDPKVRANKECIFNTLVESGFKKALAGRGDQEQIDSASTICSVGNVEARECLYAGIHEGLRIAEATQVCKIASSDTRACLVDSYLRRGDFGTPAIKGFRLSSENAVALCKISNRTDRQCVLTTALARAGAGSLDGQVHGATLFCATKSKERGVCAAIVNTRLKALGIGQDLRRAESYTDKICEIPNFEVRSCVLDKVPDVLKERAFLSEVIATCQTAFVRYFFSPLDSVGAGKNCGFNRE